MTVLAPTTPATATTALVRFELEDMDVQVPLGASFLDIVEASGADVTFGCRNGTCGTCRVRIDAGEGNCTPMNREERDFLASIEAAEGERLGCQLCINGDVSISYLG